MKLKELPQSLAMSWRLANISREALEDKSKPQIGAIVSFTSIPSRLKSLHLVIRSLMAQTVRPERIVLWLNADLQDQLPPSLIKLTGELFEIRYSALTCSHRKLIHSLEAFPESTIITCDDDIMYHSDWLEKLWQTHTEHPTDIIANQCRVIRLNSQGEPLPYQQWSIKAQEEESSPWLLPIGSGGVLYPPHSLDPQVHNQELFLQLTPRADDLWFKAMSFIHGTQCRRATDRPAKPVPIAGTQKISLKRSNVRQDHNREQWAALLTQFKEQLTEFKPRSY